MKYALLSALLSALLRNAARNLIFVRDNFNVSHGIFEENRGVEVEGNDETSNEIAFK